MNKIDLLKEKLKDARGNKVIFVSHCLLNENTRYLGGATRKGPVNEILDELKERGVGIVQMKCPEQKAWGGVLKKEMLRAYGAKNIPVFFRNLYINQFIAKTKRVYKVLACEVAQEIDDYKKSGVEVVGVIAINGSPTCGNSVSMDLRKSADLLINIDTNKIDKDELNNKLYKDCLVKQEGLFIKALKSELWGRNISVPFFDHDLVGELKGEKSKVLEAINEL